MGPMSCAEPQCLYKGALLSSAVVKKEKSYTSTPRMGRTACTDPQCLYKGALPSSAVVKKEYSYTSTPLYAVRPVQSLSACTTVHSLLVPWSRKSRAIPLLLL